MKKIVLSLAMLVSAARAENEFCNYMSILLSNCMQEISKNMDIKDESKAAMCADCALHAQEAFAQCCSPEEAEQINEFVRSGLFDKAFNSFSEAFTRASEKAKSVLLENQDIKEDDPVKFFVNLRLEAKERQ